MKSLFIAAVSLLASVQFSSAGLFGSMVGTWTQLGTEPGSKVTTVYQRFDKTGLVATTTIILPDMKKSIGTTRYFADGRVTGKLQRDGAVRSTHSGTWSISRNTLNSRIKVVAPAFPSFIEKVRTTLVKLNKITVESTSSDGVRSAAILMRKL